MNRPHDPFLTVRGPLSRQCMRRLLACLIWAGSCLSPACLQADSEIYRKVLSSTAWVLSRSSGETSSGTGVLVDAERRLVATNFHVVGEARTAVLFFPELRDGQPIVTRQHYLDNVKRLGVRGRVIAVDRKRDLALIELDKLPAEAIAIPLATDSISPGATVSSIGHPGATEALWVFSSGTVRAVYQKTFRTGAGEHEFKVVDTQAPINSGDSGGPVVNSQGELVAIAQAISPSSRLVSFNVDISEVREFLTGPWKPAPMAADDLLNKAELKFVRHATGDYEVELTPKDSEKLSVFVAKDVEYFERADVRRIWALGAVLKDAPNQETSLKLLTQNARTKLGSWTVEKNEQGQYLVMYCVKLDATASPETLRSTMDYVARLTSAGKQELKQPETPQTASQTLDAWLAQ